MSRSAHVIGKKDILVNTKEFYSKTGCFLKRKKKTEKYYLTDASKIYEALSLAE